MKMVGYSSSADYCGGQGLLEIDMIDSGNCHALQMHASWVSIFI